MTRISPEHLNHISKYTNSDRKRALVIVNRFWWHTFGRTYRNSADLLVLDGPQADALLSQLVHEWDNDSAFRGS